MMWTRGNPTDAIIHLRIPQQRPGMIEGKDFSTHVACDTGSYHIHITNHTNDVTCEKCKEVGRIKAWNMHVDDVIHAKQTFSMETPEGTLFIELGFKGMKEQKYASWLQHKEDTIVYAETPHEAYSDLIGGV